MVVVAQLVRAPGCGPGGRRFESDLPPHFFCLEIKAKKITKTSVCALMGYAVTSKSSLKSRQPFLPCHGVMK